MYLNNSGALTLTDAVEMARPAALASITFHQASQMIIRQDVYVDILIGNDYPLVDALDAHTFQFTTLEQTLHTIMADDHLLLSILVKWVAIPI